MSKEESSFRELWKMGMKHHDNGLPGWQVRFCVKRQSQVNFKNLIKLQCWNCKQFVVNEGICDPL